MQITTNLDLSKKAFELGITKYFESVFYWIRDKQTKEYQIRYTPFPDQRIYPALTAEEWGSILPIGYYTKRLITDDNKQEEWIAVLLPDSEYKDTGFRAETEADARAKMSIYLKEQGII